MRKIKDFREMRMKALKKLFVLVLALALVGLVAPTASQAAKAKTSTYSDCSEYHWTIKVTDSKGNVVSLGDSVKDGTQLTVTVTLNPGYEWDNSEDSYIYVQGENYTLDKNHSAKFKVKADDDYYSYFSIGASLNYKELPHFEYYHNNGFIVTVKDAKGNDVKEGDLLTDGDEYTATIKLADGYEWLYENTQATVGWYNTYDLDKKGSFKFTYNEDDNTVVYISPYYYPSRCFTASITSDSHVKSYTFVNATSKKKASETAGQKEYLLDHAHGLSGDSIAIKVVLENGYEIDEVTLSATAKNEAGKDVAVGKIFNGFTSDSKLLTISPMWGGYGYTSDGKVAISITTKKAGSGTIALDKKKYKVVAPTVSGKLKKITNDWGESYKTGTKTLKFSKAKKGATTLYIDITEYVDYTSAWIDSEKSSFGSDLADCEIIDLTGVKDLDDYTISSLVYAIYTAYKGGLMPELKAIYLPSANSIEIKSDWANYGVYENYYYPIQVITAD